MRKTKHYYEGTGLLKLAAITPVITALFSPYNLNKATSAQDKTTIAINRKFDNPTWNDVFMNLTALAQSLGYQPDSNTHAEPIHCLSFFTRHFDVKSLDTEYLHIFCEDCEPDMQPTLEELFELATHFNDGHNLQSIMFSGVHHCNEPEFGAFHGECIFISHGMTRWLSTENICEYMNGVMTKFALQDLDFMDHLCLALFCELQDALYSLHDQKLIQTVQLKLIAALKNPQELLQRLTDPNDD
ncbi:hypothetical protein CUZ56_01382 [Saezia sanguinis]|uniref:Uncharacterized protein n=1 Tax=Saezia sanguinis TaxID=1965230 RepID=A0A433SFB5_9BURK|nr:hypothetical protein [Saezia sanguinis]RUS67437.1 hypothetical protein CUZ56_01382 [Saezia sanguinis]